VPEDRRRARLAASDHVGKTHTHREKPNDFLGLQ